MIGNLVLSLLSLTFCGAVIGSGQLKADAIQYASSSFNSVSHITGDDVVNYLSFEKELTSPSIPNSNVVFDVCYDSDGNLVSGVGGMYSSGDITTTYGVLALTQSLEVDYIHLLYSKDSSNIVNCRILVPASMDYIYNVEFNLTGTFNYGTFMLNLYSNNTSNSLSRAITYEGGLNWFGFSRGYIQTLSGGLENNAPLFMFTDFGFTFLTSSDSYLFHFDFIGQYSNSVLGASYYDSGYRIGYQDGVRVGYASGYNDGVGTAQQGTFHNLFNSIADTPLRFLYGIFNFDLFGLSMLVIVLTLLTGLIVFGIVKKFWK